ncbi:hypothetical protein K227x_11950 [Rubripirellula lacrimiformis]|uniref:Uncharacterized protein n=1 Tax=Rubripirellula lacrimiformis TaxID=1930273 RepID=A0A517N6Q8_9BACT|nr:hypothetical protein [Rubripirellula lacrimiformis]QDT02817.1 hypothetical protein K227x_11950 [Rubripirellula lacrimiformis]
MTQDPVAPNPESDPLICQFHVYLYGEQGQPIPASFEDASNRLQKLPLLHFEPDGSLVWARRGGRELMYGMLYDAAGQLQYCEIRGKCCLESWISLQIAITGVRMTEGLHVMRIPDQELQDLQVFEQSLWLPGQKSTR